MLRQVETSDRKVRPSFGSEVLDNLLSDEASLRLLLGHGAARCEGALQFAHCQQTTANYHHGDQYIHQTHSASPRHAKLAACSGVPPPGRLSFHD
jgi:hypothetical protein